VLEPLRQARGGRRPVRPPRRKSWDFSSGDTKPD
jgi:hypothetical protein